MEGVIINKTATISCGSQFHIAFECDLKQNAALTINFLRLKS
jgi:hypothetical protein